jgi:hypothetical protein
LQRTTARGLIGGVILAVALAAGLLWEAKKGPGRPAASPADVGAEPNPGSRAPKEPRRSRAPARAALPDASPSASAATVNPFDEPRLMARMRIAARNDSALAIELAREGNRRYPDSPDAPERTSILIHALANLDRSSEARGEAERMVSEYPDSSWVREIERFTGAHRHRNIQVSDAGTIEYE